jgi:hypothetical protein
MNMKEIRLHITNKGIMAHWLNDEKPDSEIVRLFETHILPTAWYNTDRATVDRARAEIAKLNPGHLVSIS